MRPEALEYRFDIREAVTSSVPFVFGSISRGPSMTAMLRSAVERRFLTDRQEALEPAYQDPTSGRGRHHGFAKSSSPFGTSSVHGYDIVRESGRCRCSAKDLPTRPGEGRDLSSRRTTLRSRDRATTTSLSTTSGSAMRPVPGDWSPRRFVRVAASLPIVDFDECPQCLPGSTPR